MGWKCSRGACPMEYLTVRNWEHYQHYKADRPAWFKLYTKLHDKHDYIRLPEVKRAHMIDLLILAARTGNRIPNDPEVVGDMIHARAPVDLDYWVNYGLLSAAGVSDCESKPCTNTSVTRAREEEIREDKSREEREESNYAREQEPESKAVASIQALFTETRERSHPRSTSIPKDVVDQRNDATRFLLDLFPERSPGAGMPPELQVWTGRIPPHRLSAAVRELQRGAYSDGTPHGVAIAWSNLSVDRQKRTVVAMLNAMLKQRERVGA